MGIETEHEEECKVMGIPESFKALSANLVVRGSIHEHHDEQHKVSSDSTRLGIVNLERDLLTDL